MASLPVNNNLNVLTNVVNQAVNASEGRNALPKQADSDSFDVIMNRVNTQTGNVQKVTNPKLTVESSKLITTGVTATDFSGQNAAKADTATDRVKSVETESKSAEHSVGTDREDNVSAKDVSEEEQEAVKEAGDKLVEEVAKELELTPEEVLAAMETLGLTAVQLLDPENMKQLLLTLSGNEDQLSIITDAELYGHLQNLLDTVSTALDELQTELGLTEEELSALIADMSVVEEVSEEEVWQTQELSTDMKEAGGTDLEGMKDYAVTVHKDGETVEVKVTVDDVNGETSTKEVVTDEVRNRPDNQNDSSESKGESKNEGHFLMQAPIEQPTIGEVAQQPIVEHFANTEEIMNQITEYIKLNLKADVQELEMQLHPASLGTVNVQIALKEGAITAQFTAQNETVKAAIESQLVQLKEQFEEQGIKVDAVEVTVGNYHYGQNYSQGQEENSAENREGSKKSRRNINLDELDMENLPEDMDDSERIAAEMMASSGNTVDYTV